MRPGQRRSAAEALASSLRCLRRDTAAEHRAHNALAAWALQFSPMVTLDPAPALLLEIGSCLAYFGGLERLRQQVDAGLIDLGYTVQQGCAPTPLAALWLAQAGRPEAVALAMLPETLGQLSFTGLPLAAEQIASLRRLGLQTLADVQSLPSRGLSRRLGLQLAQLLDRALGRQADPRQPYQPPDQFERQLDLNYPVQASEALLFAGRRLLIELSGFLRGRGLGVQQVTLRLTLQQRPDLESGQSQPLSPPHHATALPENRSHFDLMLAFGRPTREVAEMLGVLKEKLAVNPLPAPALGLTLQARVLHALDAPVSDLFSNGQSAADFALLAARLKARLGDQALTGIQPHPDHRPERAWRASQQPDNAPQLPATLRPAWLLHTPQPLELRDARPWLGEPLQCQGRAERIESGWWDSAPIARDYYLACGPSGRRYWIYFDRKEQSWYLHGLFD